jgi:uncharacterized membrane protein
MAAGTKVGTVVVLRDGAQVDRVALVTDGKVPGAGFLRRVVWSIGGTLTLVLLLFMVSAGAFLGIRVRRSRKKRERIQRRREQMRAAREAVAAEVEQ